MIRKRGKAFILISVALVSLWGAILGFGNPLACAWPDMEDLIRGKVKLPTSSAAIDLEHQGLTQLEETIALAIVQREFFLIRFDPERDFVGHALPGSLRVWRYEGGIFDSVDEGVAMREVRRPLEMVEFTSGDYARLFRFAVVHESTSYACVVVEAEERMGRSYEFWHLFRPGFGLGRWRVVVQDALAFSY